LSDGVGSYGYGRENEIVVCPWHGYEYDLGTGEAVVRDPHLKVKVYEVTVEDGYVTIATP
jgi:nitrite reductase/ring-hydroxylating ferredoxin subunit